LDVVSVAESTKLFLSGRVPYIEFDGTPVGVEDEWVDFDAECGDVLLFELSGEMSLDEGCLTDAAVSDEDEFELGNVFLRLLEEGVGVSVLFA